MAPNSFHNWSRAHSASGPSVSSFSDRPGSGLCLEAPTNGSFPSRCIFSPEPLSRPPNNFWRTHSLRGRALRCDKKSRFPSALLILPKSHTGFAVERPSSTAHLSPRLPPRKCRPRRPVTGTMTPSQRPPIPKRRMVMRPPTPCPMARCVESQVPPAPTCAK